MFLSLLSCLLLAIFIVPLNAILPEHQPLRPIHRTNHFDADFDGLFKSQENVTEQVEYIPKVAHLVLSYLKPAKWTTYATVRGALDRMKVDKVQIWIPEDVTFPSGVWDSILSLPRIIVRTYQLPDSVYGHKLEDGAHLSDIVRMKILYVEGGKHASLAGGHILGEWVLTCKSS